MLTRKFNDEVLYSDEPIVRVTREDVGRLKAQALQNDRKRMRLCAHRSTEDTLHEMLIVLTPKAYIRPHRHLDKCESFHVIEGRADILLFDDRGALTEVIPMGDPASGLCFYYRVADPVYHTVRVISPLFVFHETTKGPFNRAETEFAPWSPAEQDPVAGAAYLEQIAGTIS